MNIIEVKTRKQLNELYNNSAWTWEGLDTSEEQLNEVVKWFANEGSPLKESNFYITTGKVMNEQYGLTGSNKYSPDLHIVSINLDDITNLSKLFAKKLMVGARWFDDIVDNNKCREEM